MIEAADAASEDRPGASALAAHARQFLDISDKPVRSIDYRRDHPSSPPVVNLANYLILN